MTPLDDGTGDMRTFPMRDSTADALLEGRIAPDDAPFGFERVAALVRDARGPATAGELADLAGTVAAVVSTVREAAHIPDGGRGRRNMLGKIISAKVLAAIAAGALGGGVAAAATGSLPGPVQSTVSSGLSHLDISIPNPDSQTGSGNPPATGTNGSTGSTGTVTSPSTSPGPAITAANEFGLCTAYAASQAGTSTDSHSVGATDGSRAFLALQAAAGAKGETVTQFCTGVTPPGRSATTAGSASTTGTGGTSGSNPGGRAPGQPPSTTPAGNAPGAGNPHTQGDVPPAGSTGSTSNGSAVTTPAGITPGSPPSGAHGSPSSSRP